MAHFSDILLNVPFVYTKQQPDEIPLNVVDFKYNNRTIVIRYYVWFESSAGNGKHQIEQSV